MAERPKLPQLPPSDHPALAGRRAKSAKVSSDKPLATDIDDAAARLRNTIPPSKPEPEAPAAAPRRPGLLQRLLRRQG